jgi:hypothetical protein
MYGQCWITKHRPIEPVQTLIIMEFYNTFKTQFELLPRVTIIYGKGQSDGETEITRNGLAIEWLWFGVFFNVC